MAWEKVKLGDVSESCLGKMLDQQKNRGDFHPYLANVNVRWGSFDLNDLPLMKFEENEQERYGLKYGDLVICEGGEPGRCAIWKEQVPNMKIQKALHRVRVNSDMDYRYVFYWFLYAGKRGALDQYFTGATIKHMPGEKLKQVVIDKPPLKTQKQIADILSAYDDLIENNQKQIKLLEEAAQRLYKQWFIDLKFPGHETTPIVDGLPKGWHYGSITEISTCYDSKRKPLSSKERDQQEKVYPYYGAASLMDYVEKFIFDGVYLLFGEDGTVITSDETPMLQYVWGKFWVNNHAHIFQGANGYSTEFLYMLCKHMKIKDIVTGVAQPKISQGRLNDKKIVIPSRTMVAKYSELTQTVFKQIRLLSDAINASKEARDRLLPKLMSGEIEV